MSNFQPYYSFDKDPIILNKSLKVELLPKELKLSGKLKILFNHKRKFSFSFVTSLDNSEKIEYFDFHLLAVNSKIDNIQIRDHVIPSFCIKTECEKNKLVLIPKKSSLDIFTKDLNGNLSYIVGHIFNFNYFFEDIKFKYLEWKIEISQSPQLSENDIRVNKLEETQINTHTIKISNTSYSNFQISDAQKLIKGLNLFLSFCIGDWRSIILPVGFNQKNETIWKPYQYFRNSKKYPSYNWSSSFETTLISNLAPLFLKKYFEEPLWTDSLHEAIYWFIASNDLDRGMESGVILAQSALELLAFTYVVNDKKLLDKEGFKKLTASDKLRLFLRTLNISIDIEEHHKKLREKMSRQNKWIDLAHAITDIRNSFTHPEHNSRGNLYDVSYETWKISLKLLELSILAICNYDYKYSNRETVKIYGQVDYVPWANTPTQPSFK